MAHRTFYLMADLVQAVKDHAVENYERDGWDFVVECYDDEMIERVLRGEPGTGWARARSPQGAIKRMGSLVSAAASVRSDIEATAF